MFRPWMLLVCFALTISSSTYVHSDSVFDFESEPMNIDARAGSLDTLTMSVFGISMNLTRSSGNSFDVWNDSVSSLSLPFGWGSQALSPFANSRADDYFIVTFSRKLEFVSVEAGNFGGQADTFVLKAYSGENGTGTLLGTDSFLWDGTLNRGTASVASVSLSGIRSIAFRGGDNQFPNSLFVDNITVAIPEPTCGGVTLAALLAIA